MKHNQKTKRPKTKRPERLAAGSGATREEGSHPFRLIGFRNCLLLAFSRSYFFLSLSHRPHFSIFHRIKHFLSTCILVHSYHGRAQLAQQV